jgi:hypothetical protein
MLEGIYLTLLAGPVVPVPVPKAVVDALTSVEATTAAGTRSGFQLKFTLSNRSPLHTVFLVAAGQTPLLRVVAVLTVNGTPQVLFDGVTTRNDVAPGPQPGESTLTLTGEDLTRVMDLTEIPGFPFPAMTPELRVLTILAKYAVFGILPAIVPSLFTDVPIPTDKTPAQQGTDLKYIEQLAHEAGYVFYLEPGPAPGTNVAYWGPEVKIGVPQPALNLDLDAHSNVESLSFSFNGTARELPIVLIQNQLTRFPIPIPIPTVNPLQPPLGLIPPLPTGIKVLRDTAKLSPMQALSRGIAAAGRSEDAVTGTGALDVVRYGRLLRARGLVGVRGAGQAYDGLYYVKSVTTTLKRGEIKQSFNLTRNALVSLTPAVPA